MMNEIRILGEFSSLVMMNILERRRIQNEEYSIVGWRDNDMHRKKLVQQTPPYYLKCDAKERNLIRSRIKA